MSDRDKKRILTSLAAGDAGDYEEEDDNTPLGDIRVPGWDDEETNANKNFDIYNDEIHDNPYSYVTHLNTIIPYPSQVLRVLFQYIHIPITLDSGATVSYILYDLVKRMAIPIHPNNQLAALADGTTKKSSLGEIDISVSVSGHKLRLRALVMKHLHVPCFGGTTFHRDNEIVANLNEDTITLNSNSSKPVIVKNDKIVNSTPDKVTESVQNSSSLNSFQPTKPKVIEEPSKPTKPATTPTNNSNVVCVSREAYVLPNDTYLIRVPDCFKPSNKVVIIPKFKTKSSQEENWIPTVCRVKDSHAVYPVVDVIHMLVVVLHHIDAHGDGHDNYREVIHEGLARDVRPVLQLDAGGILRLHQVGLPLYDRGVAATVLTTIEYESHKTQSSRSPPRLRS